MCKVHPEMLSYEMVFWLVNLLQTAKQNREQESQQSAVQPIDHAIQFAQNLSVWQFHRFGNQGQC